MFSLCQHYMVTVEKLIYPNPLQFTHPVYVFGCHLGRCLLGDKSTSRKSTNHIAKM